MIAYDVIRRVCFYCKSFLISLIFESRLAVLKYFCRGVWIKISIWIRFSQAHEQQQRGEAPWNGCPGCKCGVNRGPGRVKVECVWPPARPWPPALVVPPHSARYNAPPRLFNSSDGDAEDLKLMRPCRPCTPLSAKWNAKGRECSALSRVAVNFSHITPVYFEEAAARFRPHSDPRRQYFFSFCHRRESLQKQTFVSRKIHWTCLRAPQYSEVNPLKVTFSVRPVNSSVSSP